MRGLKLFLACAVVGAAMVTAAFGAGSASAANTVICKTNTPTCGLHAYPNSQVFEVVGKAEFKGTSSFSCGFAYKYELEINSLPVVLAEVQSWNFSGCTPGHSVGPVGLPGWPMKLKTVTVPNGTGEMFPTNSKPFEIDGCVYQAATIPLTIEGGGWITTAGVTLNYFSGPGSCASSIVMSIPSSKPTSMFWMTN
jgi:hypothetical protein